MPMPILVNELRLSLVWTKAFAKDALLPYLASGNRFKSEFSAAKSGQGTWLLPWLPGERQHFWQYYLGVSEIGGLEDVNAERAWGCLVPLRAPTWAQITPPKGMPSEGLRISLEGFCFPHSTGVVAMVFVKPTKPLTLVGMVDRAVEVRNTQFNAIWKDDSTATHGTLDSLADELIDKLHRIVLGQSSRGKPLSQPLTIATVIDATGVWTTSNEDKMKSPIGRALQGLCQLQPGWDTAGPGEVSDEAPTHDRLVSHMRGRAIWLPRRFTNATSSAPNEVDKDRSTEGVPKRRARALGCYHRNLTLATLQTKSLTALVNRASDFLPNPISVKLRSPVKVAIGLLDELYEGSTMTYQSWSLKEQIQNYDDVIKTVRQAVG